MARRRYYRRSYRAAPKKKWASNMKQGLLSSSGDILVENSVQGATPTPVILKCGNFKVQGDITVNVTNAGSLGVNVFLMYLPEGFQVTTGSLESALQNHAEWVMGWTSIDTPIVSTGPAAGNKFSISTRLKRNLNSGDKVVLYTQGIGTATFTFGGSFVAQFFTCAN